MKQGLYFFFPLSYFEQSAGYKFDNGFYFTFFKATLTIK